MFKIEGTKIKLTRGDSMCLKVNIIRGEVNYTPQANDYIRFALKHAEMLPNKTSFRDPAPVLVKVIPNDTMLLKLDPQDTKKLKFGSYVYDIEITFGDGQVDTFVPNASFELMPEVD